MQQGSPTNLKPGILQASTTPRAQCPRQALTTVTLVRLLYTFFSCTITGM